MDFVAESRNDHARVIRGGQSGEYNSGHNNTVAEGNEVAVETETSETATVIADESTLEDQGIEKEQKINEFKKRKDGYASEESQNSTDVA